VLNGLDLDIPDRETLVVMGKSGCGKSVLLKIILRLIFPDEGGIFIDGVDTSLFDEKQIMPFRKNIGMLFQGAALFDSMTVWENLAFPLYEHTEISAEEIDDKIGRTLDFVSMDGTQAKFPSELSGGMKKRVALARALILTPDYVFFDEPTTGLDPVTSRLINQLVIKTREEYGVTSIVVTHDLASAATVGTTFAFLHSGKIRFYGSYKELISSEDIVLKEFIKDASWRDRQ